MNLTKKWGCTQVLRKGKQFLVAWWTQVLRKGQELPTHLEHLSSLSNQELPTLPKHLGSPSNLEPPTLPEHLRSPNNQELPTLRRRKSERNRWYKSQKKIDKRINNDLQIFIQKTKDWATWTSQKNGGALRCSGRVTLVTTTTIRL
jgi:hypothetical protein